jgi:lysyl-tRNA synthetase class 2
MEGISAAGRILSIRKIGKLTFMVISDLQGSIQLALKQDDVGKDAYDLFHSCFDIGDWIGVKGKTFTTKTGEKTVRISEYVLLGKSLKVLPEKWHGLTDKETRYRQRYLDLIMSRDTADRSCLKRCL